MKVFKSPLLLLGILIIALATSALVVPYFVDWNGYRGKIERYGEQLTGRETQVLGDISVRLFPWPRLSFADVRVANPPGARLPELLRAERVDVRMALAPLLSGRLEVQGIDLERPVFGLERMAAGRGTWKITPKNNVTDIFAADDIVVDGISINDGTVVLADGKRGGESQIDRFNAVASSRSLAGPWKLRGTAVVGEDGLAISVTTGKWRVGRPLKFAFRLAPTDTAGAVYSFDGATGITGTAGKDLITGRLKVTQATSKRGKSNLQSDFRPLTVKADVTADFDTLNFSKIEIAPQNSVDINTFVTGSARVTLGSVIRADAALKAARLNVDSLLGNRGRRTLRSLRSLDALARIVESLPKRLELKTRLDVTSLVIGDQTFDSSLLDFSIFENTLKVRRLSLNLPGTTKARFSGSMLAGKGQSQLIGDLVLDGVSLKDFSKWARPDLKREIEERWSGQRGQFRLAGKVDLSPANLRLNEADFRLDDTAGKLAVSVQVGDDPAVSVRLSGDSFSFDDYSPQGVLPLHRGRELPGRFLDFAAGIVGSRDVSVAATLGKMRINGIDTGKVSLDLKASENGLDLRALNIQDIAGARVGLSGVIKFDGDKVSGALDGDVTAAEPAGMFKLINIWKPSDAWLAAASPMVLRANLVAVDENKRSVINTRLTGSAGTTQFSGNGKFTGNLKAWEQGRIHVSGQAASTSTRQLLALGNIAVSRGKDGPARLALTATGTLKDGLASTADFSAFGVQSQFSGKVARPPEGLKVAGRLAMLVQNTDQVLEVLGMYPGRGSPIARVFSAEGELDASHAAVNLKNIRGTAAGSSFGGDLRLSAGAKGAMVAANMKIGRASAGYLLGATLLERTGKAHDWSARFASDIFGLAAVDLKIQADRLELWPQAVLEQSQVALRSKGNEIALSVNGVRGKDEKVSMQLDVRLARQLTRIGGSVSGEILLPEILKTAQGAGVLGGMLGFKARFSGAGRTPSGVLADLSGKGGYEFNRGVVKNMSPARFAQKLPGAETAKDVERLISDVLRKGDMPIGAGRGGLKIANGVVNFDPVKIAGAGGVGTVRVIYELATGLSDVSVRLTLNQPANVPGFEIAYAGAPLALAPSSDFSALKSHLSVAALNRTLDKLEALQEEQRRLFEQERKAREEAEKKRRMQLERQRLLREKQRLLLQKAQDKKQAEDTKKAQEKKKAQESKKAGGAAEKRRREPKPQNTKNAPVPQATLRKPVPKPVLRSRVKILPPPVVVGDVPAVPAVIPPTLPPVPVPKRAVPAKRSFSGRKDWEIDQR